MGGQFSTGNNSVWVAVERPTYMPGEVVDGRVLLNCSTPFQACKLVLKVEGYESTRWEESVSYSEWDEASKSHVTRHRTETRSGKRDFFKVKIPLASFAHQTVMPGQYEYGWSTVLPMGLPGSFDLSSTSHRYADVKAKIMYKVKAECEVPGLLKPNLKHKARLWVQQPLLRPASEIIVQDTQSVKVCCCCNKGSASLTAQVERDSYLPGDLACVVLQVDNQSSVNFERVELKLKHCIQLSDGGCHHYHRDHKLVASAAPGVKAGVTQAGEGARRLCVQLPPDLQPTTLGHLVKCHYLLEIKCKAPSCISDLKVKVPVGVFPPATAVPVVYTQPPPGWHPAVVVPGVVVDIPSAPPCPPYQQTMVMDASKADGKGDPSCPPGQPYLPEPIKASYPPV